MEYRHSCSRTPVMLSNEMAVIQMNPNSLREKAQWVFTRGSITKINKVNNKKEIWMDLLKERLNTQKTRRSTHKP